MGETRVDLLHLLEDLRDAYTGSLEETILTEIVANSLDSGARRILISADAARGALTVVDDGSGMRRRDLARYHDIASSTKTRGEGIGFAGVGIKLGLLLSQEVITETRRGKVHVASRWHLASRHRAPWRWIPPAGIVTEHGTAVTLRPINALSPLLESGFVEGTIRRHFEALLEPRLAPMLVQAYPHGIRFEVNDREVSGADLVDGDTASIEIRLARKRKPSALGFMVREMLPLPEDRRGIAISTRGKVIRRGWDWLGVTPTAPERIGGLIEAPELAACLTLNKADFIRSGGRGATYLSYRKALQEVVARQLAAWGDARDSGEEARRRAARPVERDLERVLIDLADDFPLLAALVERREGGQRRLPIGREKDASRVLVAATLAGAAESNGIESEEPLPPEESGAQVSVETAETSEDPLGSESRLLTPGERGPRRPTRYGLSIQFEARPGDPELGRLVESTVWVNEAHPAHARAVASRSEGYHVALAVAMALAPLAVEPSDERRFVNAFLGQWGQALDGRERQRRGARGSLHRR